jgi:ATP-dependent Lhr-like helicase
MTTMTLPPSGSDSSSFELLHERVRRWIWDQQWSELRDVQETAIRTILRGESDVIITAATAAGKTEAAFLPICSTLLEDRRETAPAGVRVLYIGPLKALINDQWRRLDGLCESLEVPVHRWHGDVTANARQKLIRHPDGILLITPESLEALFVRRGTDVKRIFAALRFVIIDELHAFIGSERGMQLQSLMHRLEQMLRRRVRRIGLSATLGDMGIAADFLRPPNRRDNAPAVVKSDESGTAVKLRLHGFKRGAERPEKNEEDDDETARSIAQHLFKHLRGSNNLVFANARSNVEGYTDRLARMCTGANLPQEFFAHHGSLSRELRLHVEEQLKRGDRPLTVVCTSTLEMGIDIGAVKSIAQIGPPPSVASLRQRLGRSGRRGEPAVLRLYIEEATVNERSSPQEAIRATLVESIAMVNLLLDKWVEPPANEMVHGSTFVQQLLSLIAQYGGITAADAYAVLCESGPFLHITRAMFKTLLRQLAVHELIEQQKDGLLLHGVKGEKFVNHYDFYTAFVTPDEYRLMTSGTLLGTLPVVNPVTEGSFLIFAGRRWRVMDVDQEKRVIGLAPAGGGRVRHRSPARGTRELSALHARPHELHPLRRRHALFPLVRRPRNEHARPAACRTRRRRLGRRSGHRRREDRARRVAWRRHRMRAGTSGRHDRARRERSEQSRREVGPVSRRGDALRIPGEPEARTRSRDRVAASTAMRSDPLQVLVDAEDVSLRILEPGRFFRAEDADLVDGSQAGQVVVFEDDAPRAELGHRCAGVGHFEADRGVLRLGGLGFGQQCQQTAARFEENLAVSARAEVPQPEDASIEIAGALRIDNRQDRGHAGSAQHDASVSPSA